MRGCSVFTRPPSISGNSVSCLDRRRPSSPSSSRYARRAAARDELASRARRARARRRRGPSCRSRDQRAHSSSTTAGQQAVLDGVDPLAQRLRGVVRSTGTRSCRDHRAGVDALVDVVDGRRRSRSTPAASASSIGVRAGKGGEQRRVDVDDAPAEAVEERPASAGACSRRSTTSSTPRCLEPVGHRRVALLAVAIVDAVEDRRRDAGLARALEPRTPLACSTRRTRSAAPRRSAPAGSYPSPLTRTPITRAVRSRARRAGASGTTAQKPMPRLKTRRASSSSTPCSASQCEDRRTLPRVPVDAAPARRPGARARGCRGCRRR